MPAIIDAETFAQARARAARNTANASRNRKRLYLFSGMLKCDACGWTYSGSAIHGSGIAIDAAVKWSAISTAIGCAGCRSTPRPSWTRRYGRG